MELATHILKCGFGFSNTRLRFQGSFDIFTRQGSFSGFSTALRGGARVGMIVCAALQRKCLK